MKDVIEKGADVRVDDPDYLIIPFRARITALLGRMTALGFKPLLWETYRTPTRAEALARKGVGIRDSIHCYGAAADVVCGEHRWDCKKHSCEFFSSLGEQAEKLNLVWGGRFKRVDAPHVQGVLVKDQARFRAMKAFADREAFVAAFLDRKPITP